MAAGLIVEAIEDDPDYIGVQIRAWTDRYCASTFIFALAGQLDSIADALTRFSTEDPDESIVEFGTRDPKWASGFCGLRLRRTDSLGHLEIDLEIWEADRYGAAKASFGMCSDPASVGAFALQLAGIERARAGSATLTWSD